VSGFSRPSTALGAALSTVEGPDVSGLREGGHYSGLC